MVNYKTIKQFAAESGYTEHAIRAKCCNGTWIEGQVWVRAPDNKPLINVEGITPGLNQAQHLEQRCG